MKRLGLASCQLPKYRGRTLRNGWTPAVSDSMDDFANIKGRYIMNLELTDDRLDVFVENPGRNIGVLQSGEQVIRVPILEQVIDATDPDPFLALFGDQRVDSLADSRLKTSASVRASASDMSAYRSNVTCLRLPSTLYLSAQYGLPESGTTKYSPLPSDFRIGSPAFASAATCFAVIAIVPPIYSPFRMSIHSHNSPVNSPYG